MAIEDDISQSLGGLPPWVSEDTLAKIASHKLTENTKLKAVYRSLTGVPFDSAAVDKAFEDAGDTLSKANDLLVKVENGTKNLFSVVARDTDPMEATAELMQMAASGIQGVVGGVTSFTQWLGPKGAMASWMLNGVATAGVAAVGVSSIYAKIMSEQEKTLRSVIDYGGVVGDLGQYTNMRGSLVDVGMSMQEMSKIMIGNKSMLANMPDSLMESTQQFINFAGMVESETSKTMGDFGYNVEQQTARLLEEANLMYMTGKLEQFGQVTKDKIRKNFESSSAMTTFLAEKFGDQRSSLLAMRSEALTNVDFMSAMQRNGEYLADKYGENAEENVKAASSTMKMLFSKIFGPEFGEQSEQVLNNFIKDIQIDDSALNNMPKELINMLSTLGPDVSKQFTDIIEKGGTGQLTKNQTVIAIQSLAKSIAAAKPRFGDDPIIQQSNALIANASNAPTAFMDMTEETLTTGVDSVKAMAEQADSSIDAIDAARVAFRSVVHELTPGYELGAYAVEGFTSALLLVEDAFKFLGLIPSPKSAAAAVYDQTKPLHQNMMSDGGQGTGLGVGATVTDDNYKDMSLEVQKAYDAYKKEQTLKQAAAYKQLEKEKTLKQAAVDEGPSVMGSTAKVVSDKLSGKVDTESASYKSSNAYVLAAAERSKQLEKEKTLKQVAAYTNAYNILKKNFSTEQFAEGGGPVPMQRPNGRWYANIKDPNSPIGSKKVYVDELNVVGMKIKNMHQLDSTISQKIKEITEVTEKTAVMENMNGG